MLQSIEEPKFYSYPGMVAVVTSRHEGVQNVMASGWHTYIGSSPGVYGISFVRKHTPMNSSRRVAYSVFIFYPLIDRSGFKLQERSVEEIRINSQDSASRMRKELR